MKKTTIAKFIAVILILGVFGGYLSWQYNDYLSPVEVEGEVKVIIPKGSSTSTISEILYDKGVIKNPYVFRFYIEHEEVASKLQAGTYYFSGTVSLEDLCSELQKGVIHAEAVKVTIPEGKKVTETIEILVKAGFGDYDKFIEYCNEGDFSKYEWIPDAKDVVEPANRLEGFLAPDTYEFYADATEKHIIDTLLAQFDKVWTSEYDKKAADLGYSVYEIVTIASLIEREVKLDSERPLVASVIYNRFDKGMLLEFCSSIQFLFDEPHPVITFEDTEMESPYNTYKYKGLPPGPVAAPGKAAIEAALNPEDTDYLYFRTKDDGTGGHYWNKTYEEHLKAGQKK